MAREGQGYPCCQHDDDDDDLSLSLSRDLSQSSIAFGRTSRLHPLSVQSCPFENVAYELVITLQCLANLVRLIWMVFEKRSSWPYNCYFVGCCFQDVFNILHSILMQMPSSLFYVCFVSVHVVHPFSSMGTTTTCKKLLFILSNTIFQHNLKVIT